MSEVIIGEEKGATFWPDGDPLAKAHFSEVEGDLVLVRPYHPAVDVLRTLNERDIFRIITARRDGELIGYYTWTVMPDVESAGLLVAMQGAWYVKPGHPRVAYDMFLASMRILKASGVQGLYPHHRVLGRGRGLGKFFRRHGAVPTKCEYYLPLTEVPHAVD
jgi:hypothetical protein